MKPKLCYIIPEYRHDDSTHFSYLLNFVEKSIEHFDVFLIVERSDGVVPTSIPKYQQKFSWFPLRLLENLVVIKYLRLRGYRDFYIHYSFLSAWNASIITKIFGGKSFYWNCGLPWQYERGAIRNFFERAVYRMVTFLVTGTENIAELYSKHYSIARSKILVMPNWIDIKKWGMSGTRTKEELLSALDIPPDTHILLFVHRLSQRKGVHHIAQIMSRLNDYNAVLLVIGDGPERENIKMKIKKEKLEKKVYFLGSVPNDKIKEYFAIADVFIMPSEEEGFPHVILEAMATGTPLVAFDVGGTREIAPSQSSQYIYPIGDIEGFSGGIISLLSDDDKRKSLREAFDKWIYRFDINNVLPIFYGLFKK